MIPYGKQSIHQNDIDAVVEVLKSDYLTQGPVVPKFEKAISEYAGAKFGVATNSATSALHIACLSLGVKKGDVVWTSPISFVASSNCALYCGAEVDFVDIDKNTYNMSYIELSKKLKEHSLSNKPLPKVVIPVHFSGQSCDMEGIHKLSLEYGFKIIEDASHAIGAGYQGKKVGNCQFSEICIFSFHPVKIITTAEGGLATTNSEELAFKMKLLRSHGITRDENQMTERSHGPWYYEQLDLGFNYRMTELQAALGLSQLDRLEEIISERRQLANKYKTELKNLDIKMPINDEGTESSWHLYVIQVNETKQEELIRFMLNKGIGVNLHYIPIYMQPYYKNKYGNIRCINSEEYYKKSLSLPLYHGMRDKDFIKIVSCLKEFLNESNI